MSHYLVAVFLEADGRSLDEALSPFNENLKVPHYISKNEIVALAREDIESYKNTRYAEYLKDPQRYIASCKNEDHIKYITEEFPKRLNWPDEECYLHQIDFYDKDNLQPDGSVFSDYNPKAKWDWCQIGGRFSSEIPLKQGGWVDEAWMTDVDINYRDDDKYREAQKFWKLYVEGQEPISDEGKEIIRYELHSKDYYTSRYDSAEEYAGWCAGFSFYAALLPSGEWIEPGEMGWWGISHAEAESEKVWHKKVKEILKEAQKKSWYVVMVDCHI